MDRDERQLRTVHEMDLDKLLDSFGVRESFDSGKILCKFCRSTVMTKDNIYSLFKESGAISFVCDKPACITESLLYLEDKKKTTEK
jgi:hypothetical protein